jgi:hypothetical protein
VDEGAAPGSTSDATSPEAPRRPARPPHEAAAELARLFVTLLQEQSAHNLEAMLLLGRTSDWREAARLQRDYVRASLERMSQFTERYAELVGQLGHEPEPDGNGSVERAA